MDVKWTRNQPYTIKNSTLFVTPTNFSSIAYLNLDEFSFDGQAHVPEFRQYSYIISNLCKLKPLEDRYSLEWCKNKYLNAEINMHIQMEYTNRSYEGIISWTLFRYLQHSYGLAGNHSHTIEEHDRYERLIHSSLKIYREFIISQIELVMEHFQNSKTIVQYFKNLCFNPIGRGLLFSYPIASYIGFFMMHSQYLKFDARGLLFDICKRENYYRECSPNQHLLWKYTSEGVRLCLNLLLKNKCPFIVSWIKPDYPQDDVIFWPLLGVYGVSQDYFYSFEFLQRLLFDIMIASCSSLCREDKDITSSIRVIWRAIPSPFLSEKQMEDNFRDVVKQTECEDYLSRNSSIISLDKPTCCFGLKWSLFQEFFPEDCITEMYQPRSLQHLARCAFRQIIYISPTENPLDSLPPLLRDYVELKC